MSILEKIKFMTIISRIDEQLDKLKVKLSMNFYETDYYNSLISSFSSKVIHQNLSIGLQNYNTGVKLGSYPFQFHLVALYILYEIMENADDL